MSKEDIINKFLSYEESFELKGLGFNDPCLGSYPIGDKLYIGFIDLINSECKSGSITAPLWQDAFGWFREKFGYDICIKKLNKKQYKFEIILNELDKDFTFVDFPFSSYQEAQLACLKKLILLCKKQ